jgi:hypothetical protein
MSNVVEMVCYQCDMVWAAGEVDWVETGDEGGVAGVVVEPQCPRCGEEVVEDRVDWGKT